MASRSLGGIIRAARAAGRKRLRCPPAPPSVAARPADTEQSSPAASSWSPEEEAAWQEAAAAADIALLTARRRAESGQGDGADADRERVLLVGAEVGGRTGAARLPLEASLDELGALAVTAGLAVVGRATQRLKAPDRATYIGTGRVAEARRDWREALACEQQVLEQARALRAETLIFDDELSPSQGRNIERLAAEGGGAPLRVCDRTALILDVFSQRAATREGVLQTQLAQLAYQTPRLTRMWTHLGRQAGGGGASGGGGGAGGATKGAGELQIELDKRLLKEQAARLRAKLEAVRTHRALHRQGRAGTPVLALCGYTSAGKSSLLNALCDAYGERGSPGAAADAALFSTLDPTTRRARSPGGADWLVTDTVGFIQKLPTQLVASFRATLEEVASASLLLHVIDAASPHRATQVAAVDAVLREMGVSHLPLLRVYNKADLLSPEEAEALRAECAAAAGGGGGAAQAPAPSGGAVVSAATGEGLGGLWAACAAALDGRLLPFEALIPFSRLGELEELRRQGAVDAEEYVDEGVRVTARAPLPLARRLAALRSS